MAPTGENASDVDANVEKYVRNPPMGLSTLDLLARTSPEGATAWQDQGVSTKVRREMQQLVKREVSDALRTQQADRPRVHDMNTIGLPKDPPPLGQQIRKTKNKFVHGTPVQRRLIAGKLIRNEESMLGSSVSVPELSSAAARQVKSLKERPEVEQDALDLALSSASPKEDHQAATKTLPQRELSPAEKERVELRQKESLLQTKLLHVTQKLSRKYRKQLSPQGKGPTTSCKIHALAQKWEEQQDTEEVSAAIDRERYNLYVAGRFSTQAELDYYPRKIEPREPATDKHRRNTIHTKYGNALAKTKCSLRGPF